MSCGATEMDSVDCYGHNASYIYLYCGAIIAHVFSSMFRKIKTERAGTFTLNHNDFGI